MKVLMINKFYYIKGGSETYLFGLKKALEENGHEVIPFSMKDERNYKSEYEEYFIDNIDYTDKNFINKVKNAGKIIYNFDAKKKLRALIKKTKPDIAHLHIFQHQISPSILGVLKEENIPIVYTVHDLKPICLNYKMMNSKGICEKCIGGKYYNCLKGKCVKNSYLFSSINVVEGYLHKLLKSYDKIDKFITPSNFYRKKMIEAGFDENRVVHIPNFIEINNFQPLYKFDDYFIYVGRLSEEKGIKTLIKAMKNVDKSCLKIVGTGPIENELKTMVRDEKINNIQFLGFKTGDELKEIVRHSRFIVIPSEWYENGPMSVIEAMAYGKPIIGSNIGGIPEMIKNNVNGYTYEAFNSNELSKCINKLLHSDSDIVNFGIKSRETVEAYYNSQYHYNKIISIYNDVLKEKNKKIGG